MCVIVAAATLALESYVSYVVGSVMPVCRKAFLRLVQDSHLPQCLAPSR